MHRPYGCWLISSTVRTGPEVLIRLALHIGLQQPRLLDMYNRLEGLALGLGCRLHQVYIYIYTFLYIHIYIYIYIYISFKGVLACTYRPGVCMGLGPEIQKLGLSIFRAERMCLLLDLFVKSEKAL